MSIAALVAAGPLMSDSPKSAAVFALQTALVKAGLMAAAPGGHFGPRTLAAVMELQVKASLPQTGIVDDATARALDCLVALAPSDPTFAIAGDMPPFAVATSLLGIYEFAGDRDNATILGWARELGGMIARAYKHDAVPWCMLFVQYCLFKAGCAHLDSLWALDNAYYGARLKGARGELSGAAVACRGAIGTKTRNGGGHTFFIVGRSVAGGLVIRGGNQSDMVCDEEISPRELYSAAWPKEYTPPRLIGFDTLPVVKSAPRDRREA